MPGKGRKKVPSTAKKVDDAWKRVVARIRKYPFLPLDVAACDWDELKYTASDSRSDLGVEEVMNHKTDLRTVEDGLGYMPSLPAL